MEAKVIGQMDNTIDHTFESANRVYDVGGVSPTINTCGGGGLQPKILENIPCATSRVSKGAFVSSQDLKLINVGQEEAGTILSRYWKGIEGDHSNAIIVAMRGRNPENPSDRTVGSPTEQRLEPNSQGICNTLTSVQKDNLVMERATFCIGGLQENQTPRTDGISPSLTAAMGIGGGQTPLINETVRIKQATSQGYIECEVGGVADLSFPDSNTRRGRVQDNGQVSPTLMAGEQDICRIEKEPCVVQKCGDRDKDGKYSIHSYSNCIPANPMSDRGQFLFEPQYRIRKLTPRECWRLMDFTDEDFEKAAQVNSNTQLYKQAGNSIVVNVLVAILGQLLPGKENVYKELSE